MKIIYLVAAITAFVFAVLHALKITDALNADMLSCGVMMALSGLTFQWYKEHP